MVRLDPGICQEAAMRKAPSGAAFRHTIAFGFHIVEGVRSGRNYGTRTEYTLPRWPHPPSLSPPARGASGLVVGHERRVVRNGQTAFGQQQATQHTQIVEYAPAGGDVEIE